jgi:lipopolysaccharide transport system permease protein
MQTILKHLDLILYKARADLRAEAQRYYISYLWWIIEPILDMLVFYLVFAVILKRGTADFVPMLLIGLTVWKWFETTVKHGATAIVNSRGLVQQVYLPKTIFPLVVVCTDTFKFLIVFAILLVYLFIYGFSTGGPWLALPLVLVTQLTLITAVACLFAAVTPFMEDVTFLINTGLRLAFYLSGIFFEGAILTPAQQQLFYLNPMATLIESFRDILMHNRWPDMQGLTLILAGSAALFYCCVLFLNRFDRRYPKVLAQ